MFAIRSLRSAGGVTIDGVFYDHHNWTLVDAVSPAVEAASVSPNGYPKPVLEIREVSGADDPDLAPHGIASGAGGEQIAPASKPAKEKAPRKTKAEKEAEIAASAAATGEQSEGGASDGESDGAGGE